MYSKGYGERITRINEEVKDGAVLRFYNMLAFISVLILCLQQLKMI